MRLIIRYNLKLLQNSIRVGNIDCIAGIWFTDILLTVINSINISWFSRSLSINMVDVISIRTMVVRSALLNR